MTIAPNSTDYSLATFDELVREVGALRTDLGIIGAQLHDEAVDRGWCSEYDDFVERVNGQTSRSHLVRCRFYRQAVFTVTVDYTCSAHDGGRHEVIELLRSRLYQIGNDVDCVGGNIAVSLDSDEEL